MTHRPASSHTTPRRSLTTLAAAAGLALLGALGTGCFDVGEVEDEPEFYVSVNCATIPTWRPGLQIKGINDQVQKDGKVFGSLIGAYTVVNDASWAPPQPTLWRQVADCGGVQPPVQQPPPPPPPVQQPPAQQPPAQQPPPPPPPVVAPPTNADQCIFVGTQAGRPGPLFDVENGGKNVGKGNGSQFITGQCLTNADCASGCCAKPCGICSGPAASFQAGKQGCGFVGSTIARR